MTLLLDCLFAVGSPIVVDGTACTAHIKSNDNVPMRDNPLKRNSLLWMISLNCFENLF